MWLWALGAAALLGLGLALVQQARSSRRVHRPLASRQPERRKQTVPLGMEALDIEALGRANRRNESLERGQTNWLGRSGFFGRTDTDVAPLADDETYAARYFDAFQKDKR